MNATLAALTVLIFGLTLLFGAVWLTPYFNTHLCETCAWQEFPITVTGFLTGCFGGICIVCGAQGIATELERR